MTKMFQYQSNVNLWGNQSRVQGYTKQSQLELDTIGGDQMTAIYNSFSIMSLLSDNESCQYMHQYIDITEC